MNESLSAQRLDQIRGEFRHALHSQDFRPLAGGVKSGARRSFSPLVMPHRGNVARLVEQNGVLRWELGPPHFRPIRRGRRSSRRARLIPSRIVDQYEFEQLEGSQIAARLIDLDRQLTPGAWADGKGGGGLRGLRQYRHGEFQPLPRPDSLLDKQVLLLVHGTFSNCGNMLAALNQSPQGKAFLRAVQSHYDYLLTFDHPTLSTSPVMNAYDLAAQLRSVPQRVDIVCHSRGGLVARWFCEAFCPEQLLRRVVFVGSPLGGTSLAAAPRLRGTCDLLSNLVNVLGQTVAWFPAAVTQAVGMLLRILHWSMSAAAHTPLFDAAMALIPGLQAQARIGNNEQLLRLRANSATAEVANPQKLVYHAVTADFEPHGPGWQFWRYFTDKPTLRALNAGADVVFSEANDLVVDTKSMSELADGRLIQTTLDFGCQGDVHHCNYFQFEATLKFIRERLGIA